MPIRFLLFLLLACLSLSARALAPERQLALVSGDSEARLIALQQAVAANEPGTAAFLQALRDGELRRVGDRVLRASEAPADAEEPMLNNRLRGALEGALAALRLQDPSPGARAAAIDALRAAPESAPLALLERALAAEREPALRAQLEDLLAALRLGHEDPAQRIAAAQQLAGSGEPAKRAQLLERLAVETDPAVKRALQQAADAVQSRLAWGERAQLLFSGISLGSILLLVALGLAITYGLMGVINMAHGELLMIGAYATWAVQQAFRAWLPPGAFDAYLLVALPVSFLVAAGVGAAMERSVIRHLYGRPLETLLATWGLSLILMQTVRSLFGAQNVAVENPGFLSGGWALLPNFTLPWNRLAIIVFAAGVLIGMALLLSRTRLGLMVRGVTQNRRMASCVGVNTARVDTLAFALGSGVAGLAGCALSQIGNVGPDLGQSYIVDAFMVVVLGGVGQLLGTVYAGLGLGVVGKLLEGWQGAVLAKIALLLILILVIQKKPQGLFALKGRSVE